MKNIILTLAILAFSGVAFVASAQVSTVATLLPSVDTVSAGQSFDLAVMVDPQGTGNYAEKIEVDYPSDILQVNSFTLDKSWMALTQPGYDSIDNINGVMIKSAGYPGGFSSPVLFGTISFTAKEAGSGVVTIGNNSVVFGANSSQNSLLGNSSMIKVVSSATPTPVTSQVTTNSSTTTTVQISQPEQVSQSAAVGSAQVPTSNGWSVWLWVLIILIIVIIGLAVYFFRS